MCTYGNGNSIQSNICWQAHYLYSRNKVKDVCRAECILGKIEIWIFDADLHPTPEKKERSLFLTLHWESIGNLCTFNHIIHSYAEALFATQTNHSNASKM